ncbi:MAG: hypothetical protein KC414_14810, partial [Romboutsia sp.]|nr:hypothetical protein [Romboutsia sp.]
MDNANIGLIFIRSKGPLDRITQIITNYYEYTSIGIYYKSSVTGSPKLHILRTYTNGIKNKKWLEHNE